MCVGVAAAAAIVAVWAALIVLNRDGNENDRFTRTMVIMMVMNIAHVMIMMTILFRKRKRIELFRTKG